MSTSVGVIGGADGPTAIFVTGGPAGLIVPLFFALLFVLALLIFLSEHGKRKRRALLPLAMALVVAADQAVKAVTVLSLEPGETDTLLPPLVRLRRIHNYGAAWSSFSGARWLLIVVTGAGLCLLAWLLLRIVRHPLGLWSVALVMAGGLGNLIDRVRLGYVVDMLEFMFFSFPVFNVADIFVTCGTICAAIYYLKYYESCDAQNWKRGSRGTDSLDG